MDLLERNYRAVTEALFLTKGRFDNISLPMKTSSDFHFIGHSKGNLFRVRVIATSTKNENGVWVANLLKGGGYYSEKEKKIHFDPSSCDWVYISTPEDKYLIPSEKITQKKAIVVSVFSEFKLV